MCLPFVMAYNDLRMSSDNPSNVKKYVKVRKKEKFSISILLTYKSLERFFLFSFLQINISMLFLGRNEKISIATNVIKLLEFRLLINHDPRFEIVEVNLLFVYFALFFVMDIRITSRCIKKRSVITLMTMNND